MVIYTTGREGRCAADLESVFYLQKRTVFLTGEITDDVSTELIRQILYLADLNREPIRFCINSPGGSVSAGLALYDVMKGCGCDIVTICGGTAASMAAFLLASGTPGKRYSMPHAEVMIHQIMGGAQGQAADIEISAEHIRRVRNTVNALLAQMTGQTAEKIRKDTDRNYYLNAEEARQYGLIDHILSETLGIR